MIYIGDYLVQEHGDEPVRITKEPSPLEELGGRSAAFTRTFGIVSDESSDKAFAFYFDVTGVVRNTTSTQFNPDFNPNLKADFKYFQNTDLVFSGFCKLDEIRLERGQVVYMVTAYSGFGEFFNELGEKRLRDLDLSSYNHTWNNTNVTGSWSNDYTDGYVYPFLSYGDKSDWNSWAWTDLKPALFVKAIWDKIFSEAGWGYSSTFLSTSHFEKLIIPNPNPKITVDYDTANDWTFTVGRSTQYSVENQNPATSTSKLSLPDDTGSVYGNALQNTSTTEFDTAGDFYEADKSRTMAFRLYLSADLTYTGASTFTNVDGVAARVDLLLNRGGNTTILETFYFGDNPYAISIYPRFEFTGNTITFADTSTNEVVINKTTQSFNILEGDIVYLSFSEVHIYAAVAGSGTFITKIIGVNGDWGLNISAGSIFGNIIDPLISVGQTMPVTRVLPDMTQREFIREFAQFFNLQVEQSEDKELLIEPRDVGYLISDTEDWSEKLDVGQEHTIYPVGALDAKEYVFTYTDDDDSWGKQYRDSWDENYGTKHVYVNSDLQTQVKRVQSKFASTVLVDMSTQNDMVLSDMSFRNDDGLVIVKEEPKPRVLYYGGEIDCAPYLYYNGTTYSTETTYPYAGHLDDPVTPEFDYLWFQPKNIFYRRAYGGTDYPQYPNGNLYNKYWWRYIQEITSPNSRIFEGYFSITPADFYELSFRKKYFFKGQTWRLIGVYDFDPSGKSLTKCKFLLTDDATDPTLDAYKTGGGYGETDDNGDPLPFMINVPSKDGNRFVNRDYIGEGNLVGGSKGFVYGDLNLVGTGVEGFGLMNASGNTVMGNNVVLINTNDREVFNNGEVWINDINIENVVTIELNSTGVTTYLDGTYASGLVFLPTLESNQYYEITGLTYNYDHNGSDYSASSPEIRISYTPGASTYLASWGSNPLTSAGDEVRLGNLSDTNVTDLTARVGKGMVLYSSAAYSGSGGDVVFKIRYRIVEV